MQIVPFDGAASEWDAFVAAQSGGTHCHRFGWKPLIEAVFGHECRYMAARDPDGTLRGVLPLVRVRSRLFGHYLVSMPFLNSGGPLGDAGAVRALAAHATELAAGSGADLLELRCRRELPVDLPVSHRKITVLLDLPSENADVLWKALPSKVRSQVRRPRKEGMTVRFGLAEVEAFYAVFARHMRDLGTPAQPLGLFQAVAEQFPDDVLVGCVYDADRPVAAGWGFRWKDELELTWASALRAYGRSAPNMLLYWSFMERSVERGVRTFDFGRCTPGGGTHRFKQQWGGTDAPLYWYQYRQGGGPAATPSPERGAYALAARLWRRLPLRLAGALGPRIVRYIP